MKICYRLKKGIALQLKKQQTKFQKNGSRVETKVFSFLFFLKNGKWFIFC